RGPVVSRVFPYTTLFRSRAGRGGRIQVRTAYDRQVVARRCRVAGDDDDLRVRRDILADGDRAVGAEEHRVGAADAAGVVAVVTIGRKSTRLNSSHEWTSY